MADERGLVTVFRSADAEAETEAGEVRELLTGAGLEAELCDDATPGVVEGSWEVRVAVEDVEQAEEVLRGESPNGEEAIDTSHNLDMEPLFSAMGTTAEIEAMSIRGLLASEGIEAQMIGDARLPQLGFTLRVPRDRLEEARAVLAKAQEEGPAAALEAEQSEPGA